MKTKTWVNYLIYILLGILFVICITFLCLFNFRDSSPEDLNIKVENGLVTITTTQETKGYGYTFKFRDEQNEILVKTDSPMLDYNEDVIAQGVEVGKKYSVSVAVNGEIDAGKSFYSKEVEWISQIFLKKPEVNISENIISWNQIENADAYDIYYTHEGEILKERTTETSLKLEELKGGKSDIYVIAVSSKAYYLQSMQSNKLEGIKIVHEIPPVRMVSFNKNNTLLSISLLEKIDAFSLYLDDKVYKVVDFEYSNNVITCNIDYVFSNQTRVGVKPLAVDEYNKCTSEPVFITII